MPWQKSPLAGLGKRLDDWRERFEGFISGQAPTDPFYLSNRTWQQKVRAAAPIAVPVLFLIALVAVAATDLLRLNKADPFEHPVVEAPARQKHLPDPKLAPTDVEVVEIRIARGSRPPLVTGIVRNNTDRKVDSAEVRYYLADRDGSLLGVESADVAGLKPHASTPFRTELKADKAEYVLVRDVRVN